MIEKRFRKIGEIAEYLGIGKSTAYRLMYAGKLPVVRVGRSRRIDKKKLDEQLEQQDTRKGG